MSKKSLDRKDAKQAIIDGRANSRSDQDIYNELSQKYYDKKGIALLITGTVTVKNKSKYKIYNNLLTGLLGFLVLFKIITVFTISIQTSQPWTLLLVFTVPIFAVYFMIQIARYNAPIYRFCGLMSIIGFLQSFGNVDTCNHNRTYL